MASFLCKSNYYIFLPCSYRPHSFFNRIRFTPSSAFYDYYVVAWFRRHGTAHLFLLLVYSDQYIFFELKFQEHLSWMVYLLIFSIMTTDDQSLWKELCTYVLRATLLFIHSIFTKSFKKFWSKLRVSSVQFFKFLTWNAAKFLEENTLNE